MTSNVLACPKGHLLLIVKQTSRHIDVFCAICGVFVCDFDIQPLHPLSGRELTEQPDRSAGEATDHPAEK